MVTIGNRRASAVNEHPQSAAMRSKIHASDNPDKPISQALADARADATSESNPMSTGTMLLGLAMGMVWMVVSSALIFLNKHLMSTGGFHFPMALSGLGMAFSSIAAWFCCRVIKVVDAKKVVTWRFYITKLMPIGLLMAATLHFGNLVYLHLTVSFIQILKAFTPVITMLALFIAGLETPTWSLGAAVGAIAIGTAFASMGEIRFSAAGVTYMMLSECFEAIRLVMTQVLLVGLKFHPIEGLMYLAPACTFWLLIGVAALELRHMLEESAFQLMVERPLVYLAAAAMGFGVNALAYIVIQIASSLTLKVLGTAKNAIVVWLGVAFLSDTVTRLQGGGYAMSLIGFMHYNYIKLKKPANSGYSKVPQDTDAPKL